MPVRRNGHRRSQKSTGISLAPTSLRTWNPSISGIWMSRKTRSGFLCRIALTVDSPSPHSPITSTPVCLPRKRRIARRASGSSSTTNARMFIEMVPRQKSGPIATEWKVWRRLQLVRGFVAQTPAGFRRGAPDARAYWQDKPHVPAIEQVCLRDCCSDCILPIGEIHLPETRGWRLYHSACACRRHDQSHFRLAVAKSAQERCNQVRFVRLKSQTAGDLRNGVPGFPCKDRES